ncbi:RNA-directed DNA polymerase, eukaryota, reverse transcriptase zinc-binding domain protein [Tanacetum coccineum]
MLISAMSGELQVWHRTTGNKIWVWLLLMKGKEVYTLNYFWGMSNIVIKLIICYTACALLPPYFAFAAEDVDLSPITDPNNNKEHAQDSSKDKDVFQKVGGRKEMVNEGKRNMKYNNKFGAKQYGQQKFVYRQIKTDIELDDNDFYFSRSRIAKFMTANEVSETHMKKDKIDKVCMKVFGSWLWQNNVRYSSKGCRIVVGWDCNNVTCTLVNATGQSMLYKVKFLSSHAIFFYTFIYAANKGRDRKELWKELSLNNRVVGKSAWVIMGDVNVNLNLEDHSEGVSNFTQDMIDFQDCVNGNELEDINYSGLHFTWTKSLLNPNATVLKKIDRIMIDKDPTNTMLRTEGVNVLNKFNEAADDEEKLLRQKAKVTWLAEGDKNSAYFHKFIKGRLNRSRIMSICAEDGKREITEEEIKKALFDIDDNKAPDPNGFTSKFYKKSCQIIRMDFCDAIKEFFSQGSFWCISKILTNRIKVALSQIVDENQSAFVPRRAITDNILLTQELLKGYNCINGPKRCAFKIDIQKAYDTVSWEFPKDIMGSFGLPSKMTDWIMTCISTPKFTICVNGERYGYFKGGRGLRQGDPISPYIFTMVMEMVNLIVKNEIMKNNTFKYHFSCRQLKITHLCFSDDLIMFSHEDKGSVTILRNALNKFSAMSGLYPNLSKCTMFCGSLNKDAKREISSIFPFKEGKLPVRYLCVPLITKKISVKECKPLVDKVCQKLNDWKNKSLSYARRAQLIASILGSMKVYWGSVFLLPKTIVNDIEKLFKRFLWNIGDS